MKRIVLFILAGLLASDRAEAVCALPNTFVAGTRAVASELNGNMTALQDCIVALQAADSAFASDYLLLAGGDMAGNLNMGSNSLTIANGGSISAGSGSSIFPLGSAVISATKMSATGQIDDNDLAAGAVDGGTGGEIEDGTITSADVADGTVTGTDILNDTVVLITDTAGDFIETITGDSEITVSGSGTEGRAVTLAIASAITRDTELALKSAASSTINAVAKFSDTTGDLVDSLLTVADTTGNVATPGSISAGGSTGASTFTMRNTADSGWVECGVVSTTFTCATDADGTPDGTL